MASDDLVWSIIGTDFCSFKLKTTKDQTFCRNEHNVSGYCSRQSCPLANSRYATIRSDSATGELYLYIKAIERSHLPSKWWEKIKLPKNYAQALELVDQHLAYFPKFLVHKNKQRLTRLTQVNLRIRRLAKEEERLGERLVPRLAPKVRRREEGRERKALAAAKVERAIERVLIDRLRSGAYGDRPINVEPNVWKRVMKGLQKEESPDPSLYQHTSLSSLSHTAKTNTTEPDSPTYPDSPSSSSHTANTEATESYSPIYPDSPSLFPILCPTEEDDETLPTLSIGSPPELRTGIFAGVGLVEPVTASQDTSTRCLRRAGKLVLRKLHMAREVGAEKKTEKKFN
ncbi:Ribosomal large subunit biogenesis protein MAK16 [Pyrenophora tritici-repentis]|nr:Ribosomal large subunit biogenesis protein MAK16 [Pyrenophora tritici-repentis]KAI0582460.1 Ribosomal large subunit biogenesis protein MAK16 [Pyrenophora tritici-repentis]KAI1578253.1 MAK16 Nuclear protein with HMG-like acidic region [Pyrenophora tritici-repentis]KAI1587604.1 MAK16 Nuclear protein with HMG-like acidic region [Pyrenophora tritici-repentis]KAI1598506.1 MAK16 Nuclear protein with HMG-like acidic region [Pyrenophora tritici-repentis]